MLKEKIKAYVSSHKDEIVNLLIDLVKIPSVSKDKDACERMKDAVKALYESYGFETTSGDEYLLSHYGKGKESIGLFAHGDVVDGGENWIYTSPFEPIIHNGFIIGRGVWDDKSAIVISLYTLIMLKEFGIPLDKEVICFTGFNEENGMSDIKKYVKENTLPTFSVVLDAGFPLYYGDKGKTWAKASSKKELTQIKELGGGEMINISLGNAKAVLEYSCELYQYLKEKCSEDTNLKVLKENDEIILKAQGISAHGANPKGTVNGAWLLAKALKDARGLSQQEREVMSALYTVLSSYYGETVGIANKDREFGDLTMTSGIVKVENKKLTFTLDLRYGKGVKMKEMVKTLKDSLDNLGFRLEILDADEAYSVDTENQYLKKYMDAYLDYTGETERKMRINAGSTYAKQMTNACETGTRYKGPWLDLPTGHGLAHQPDENTSIEGLLNAVEIVAYAIIKMVQK